MDQNYKSTIYKEIKDESKRQAHGFNRGLELKPWA
jgi:hypothetical protein